MCGRKSSGSAIIAKKNLAQKRFHLNNQSITFLPANIIIHIALVDGRDSPKSSVIPGLGFETEAFDKVFAKPNDRLHEEKVSDAENSFLLKANCLISLDSQPKTYLNKKTQLFLPV